VEFAVAAIDVADDLVDDEWDWTAEQRRRAVNASLALSALAQRCALDLVEPLGAARAGNVAQHVAQASFVSCAGQDLDLRLEAVAEVSEQQAHDMTREKSGSLVAMACQVGAAVATDDAEILEAMGRFGAHVGIMAQLENDLAGVDGGRKRGSDIRRRKKTLPVAYALRCAEEEDLPEILSWYRGIPPVRDLDEERVVSAIRETGALHYAWVVADAHRGEAVRILLDLIRVTGRGQVRQLRRLIPVIRERRAP
jgi:geranylgeranyl pyrophosphate synthase